MRISALCSDLCSSDLSTGVRVDAFAAAKPSPSGSPDSSGRSRKIKCCSTAGTNGASFTEIPTGRRSEPAASLSAIRLTSASTSQEGQIAGKESVDRCTDRGQPYHQKKKLNDIQ